MKRIITKVLDLFTLVLSISIGIKSFKRIHNECRYVLLLAFDLVFVLPLLLDLVLGVPDYYATYSMSFFRGFIISVNDTTTRVIYDCFLLITEFIIYYYKPKYRFVFSKSANTRNNSINYKNNNSEIILSDTVRLVLLIVAFLPPLLSLLFGFDFKTMLSFGWREFGEHDYTITNWYSTVEKLTYIGVVSSLTGLLLKANDKSKRFYNYFYSIAFVLAWYLNISIESKRSIIFFSLLIYLIVKLNISNAGGKTHLLFLTSACVLIVLLSTIYIKVNVRGYSSFESLYSSIRIDLFRDDTVKMVIYSFLGKDLRPLLDYPLQSYITQISFIFPLDFLVGKGILPFEKIGFNTYLTSSMIGRSLSEGNNFMTTSLFDELIANFWFIGFFIGGSLIVRLSLIIDRLPTYSKIIWLGAIILMMFYSLCYIMYYLEASLILTIVINKVIGKKEVKQ